MTSSIWTGIQNAEIFDRGQYFGEGQYEVEVGRAILKQTKRAGLAFIVELTILQSSNPDDPVGASRTWYQGLSNMTIAHGAVKEFVAALFGFDPREHKARIDQELSPHLQAILDAAVSEQNSLHGKRVRLETYLTKTKAKGVDFTVHRWTPFTGQAIAVVAQAPKPPTQVGGVPIAAPFAPPPQQIPQGFASPQQAMPQAFAPPAASMPQGFAQVGPSPNTMAAPLGPFAPPAAPPGWRLTPQGWVQG